MSDRCHNCGNTSFENRNVTLTLERENKLFKIQNVPAKVCTKCDEQYFAADIYDSVYKLINNDKRKSVIIEAEELEFV